MNEEEHTFLRACTPSIYKIQSSLVEGQKVESEPSVSDSQAHSPANGPWQFSGQNTSIIYPN